MAPRPSFFVSYSIVDQEIVAQVAHHLSLQGARVWFDVEELETGDLLAARIEAAIEEVDYFVPIVSAASVDSDWCRRELASAQARPAEGGARILPLRLGEVTMPEPLEELRYIQIDPADTWAAADALLRAERQDLRDVIGFSSEDCDVIVPAKTHRSHDFLALAHVLLDGCARLDIPAHTVASGSAVGGSSKHKIVLGGWRHNAVTKLYLQRWPGFRSGDGSPENWRNTTHYLCGGEPIEDSGDYAVGFLCKLKDAATMNGTVHLIWGHRGLGTAAAGYYLTHHYRWLASAFGDRPYFVVVKAPVAMGYRAVRRDFEDYSGPAATG